MDCNTCRNAVILTGAYTRTCYLECKIEQEIANNATDEEIMKWINYPEKQPQKKDYCKYRKGKPQNGGITFDD